MKLFQKRPVAALIMVLAILLGLSMARNRRPDVPAAPPSDDELLCVLHNEGGVLADKTVRHMASMNEALFAQTGAQIVVDVVETTGSQDIVDYADDVFYQYGIGSRERDNGILMVLALKNLYNGAPDGDYYITWGSGFSSSQTGQLENAFFACMEDDFAAKRYDEAVRNTFDALIDELEDIYGLRIQEGVTTGAAGYEQYGAASVDVPFAVGNIIGLLIALFVVWMILDAIRYQRYRSYSRRYPTARRYYPIFWGRPGRRIPPPPPPGFGGAGRPSGGFHTGGTPGGGARRPSGGFHTGGTPGGGARRPSGGFHIGGTPGGGARRPSGGFHTGGSSGGGARRPSGGMKASRPSGGARRSSGGARRGGGSRPSGGGRRR